MQEGNKEIVIYVVHWAGAPKVCAWYVMLGVMLCQCGTKMAVWSSVNATL